MSMHQHQIEILTILHENLSTPQPQLVSTAAIAQKMDVQLPKLQQILQLMNSMGTIQTDSELKYNLITREGLNYLNGQYMYVPSPL